VVIVEVVLVGCAAWVSDAVVTDVVVVDCFKKFSFFDFVCNKDVFSLEASMQNYRRSLDPEFEKKHFIDFQYKEIVANPYECIKKAYGQFGFDFTEEYAAKMKHYLAENPKGKHGKHDYHLKSFGLTDQMVREAFKPIYGETTPPQTPLPPFSPRPLSPSALDG